MMFHSKTDPILKEQLEMIEEQVHALYAAEGKYLSLDAATEHLLYTLGGKFKAMMPGKEFSEAALLRLAKETKEWAEHKASVAIAESEFHRQKHLLDLKNAAYQAAYLSLKIESEAIKRGVG